MSTLNQSDIEMLLLRLGFMESLALAAIDVLKQKGHMSDAGMLQNRRDEFNKQFKHPLAKDAPK